MNRLKMSGLNIKSPVTLSGFKLSVHAIFEKHTIHGKLAVFMRLLLV